MAGMLGHPSGFTSDQDGNQKKSKESSDGVAKVELNRDRRSQVSDEKKSYVTQHVLPTLEYEPCHENVTLLKAELKAVANDRDILRRETSRMAHQLETLRQLQVGGPPSAGAGAGAAAEKSRQSHHDYEWLKSQCDRAMNELQSLKQQHSDTVRNCDMYKHQYEALKESMSLIRSQYDDAASERQQLESEREELRRLGEEDRREIAELRKRQRDALGESDGGGSYDEFSVMYDAMVDRYDNVKQDYEALRKQYADSAASLGAASARADVLHEENVRLRKQTDVLRDEKKTLQQNLTLNLHAAHHEQKSAAHQLQKLRQEKRASDEQLSQALADKLRALKDATRLKEERNAALRENSLIMSERGAVHKEMEQLQDRIVELRSRTAALENEKASALDEADRLRELLGSDGANVARYHANFETEQEEILNDFDLMLDKRSSSDRESIGPSSRAMPNGKSKDKPLLLGLYNSRTVGQDGGYKELDNLRRLLDERQSELKDAVHELEDAKSRRDWAFSERDKIVKERESIRTLCDKLRHERDSAVSELIGALRDSDELRRQKNDAVKELKDLKEKYESLKLEKVSHNQQLNSVEYSHSRDSAIDADLQEWEMETVELDIGKMHSPNLGFDLVAIANDPHDVSVFVRSVDPASVAYGKLKVNDRLLRVNDVDVMGADKAFIYQTIRNSLDPIHLVVRRRKLVSSRAVFPIRIYRSGARELGISLEQGLYVSCIVPGSLAAKEGNLAIGDRILSVNGFSLENCSAADATRLLLEGADHVLLNVLRYCPTPTSSIVSSISMFSATNFENLDGGGSYRSPHDPTWKTPTEETNSGRVESSGGGATGLKTSGSQTDGLDGLSNETSLSLASKNGRSGGGGAGEFDRSQCGKRILNASDTAGHERNIFDKAKDAIARRFNRAARDARSKSTHPYVNGSIIEEWRRQGEDDTVESPTGGEPRADFRSPNVVVTGKKPTKSHGTWPKCRSHDREFVAGPIESSVRSRNGKRPHLPQLTTTREKAAPGQALVPDHKVPPLPPTRRDSFHRSASMKHSPQNSDASSSAKYASSGKPSGGGGGGAVLLRGNSADGAQPIPGDTFSTSSDGEKSQTYDGRHAATGGGPSNDLQCLVDVATLSCFTGSNGSEETPVVRRTTQQQSSGLRMTLVTSPMSSSSSYANPYRNSLDASRLALAASRFSENLPQKPTSLDVHPSYMYSPRPLPHSGLNITPTAPRSHQSAAPGGVVGLTPLTAGTAGYRPKSASASSDQKGLLLENVQAVAYRSQSSRPTPLAGFTTPYSSEMPTMSRQVYGRMAGLSIPETPDFETSPSYGVNDANSFFDLISSSSPVQVSNVNLLPYRVAASAPSRSSTSSHRQPDSASSSSSHAEAFSVAYNHNQPTQVYRFPERRRIPSSPSVVSSSKSSGGVISSPGSFDAFSDSWSNVSPYLPSHQEFRRFPISTSNSLPKMTSHEKQNRPRPRFGETRMINVEKSEEPLGIHIESGSCGGIFVSSVSDDSLASRAGIEIGDQLLEVCGINMRNATKQVASSVLRQCGGSINMLVQYNPEKYRGDEAVDSDDMSNDEDDDDDEVMAGSRGGGGGEFRRGSKSNRARESSITITPETFMIHNATSSSNVLNFMHSAKSGDDSLISNEQPRLVTCKKLHVRDSVGVELVGGNAVGIFVKSISTNSLLGGPKGLCIGDQILEFNKKDFRDLTLEEAIVNMNKPCDQVVCLAQLNYALFVRIQDQPGDSFYVRTFYDRPATGENELGFARGDILFVDNTVFNGRLGTWWAYLVSEDGDKLKCGAVPSKAKLDEELSIKRSLADLSASCQSGAVRRSFFQRHKHHHNSSKDATHEPNSFSDTSLNNESARHVDDTSTLTLERIEKFDCSILRPVLIVGAFAEQIIRKLTSESPDKFWKYDPDAAVDVEDSAIIEYRNGRDGMYKAISIGAMQQIMNKNRHSLLNVPPETIEKLQQAHLFPIVLFIKYKSTKQIREVKDSRFVPDKMSNKTAKDLFEQSQENEQKYRRLFTDLIPGGNLALMCCKIKTAIDAEQKKTLWVPYALN